MVNGPNDNPSGFLPPLMPSNKKLKMPPPPASAKNPMGDIIYQGVGDNSVSIKDPGVSGKKLDGGTGHDLIILQMSESDVSYTKDKDGFLIITNKKTGASNSFRNYEDIIFLDEKGGNGSKKSVAEALEEALPAKPQEAKPDKPHNKPIKVRGVDPRTLVDASLGELPSPVFQMKPSKHFLE